jgi:trehalose 6-phosphate synthase/phosphatase
MEVFVQRTHGTYIESKGSALIWQVRDADPEFGHLQCKELEEHLTEILAGHAVDIIHGGGLSDGYIEVRPKGVSKGFFLDHVLEMMSLENKEVDFIMALGDDISDEPTFEHLNVIKEKAPYVSCYGITVGKKPTSANAYVDDVPAVLELLSILCRLADRDKGYYSSTDLGELSGPRTVQPPPRTQASGRNSDFLQPPSPLVPGGSSRVGTLGRAMSDGNIGRSHTMPRSASRVEISMSEYLDGIQEGEEDECDGGIFF